MTDTPAVTGAASTVATTAAVSSSANVTQSSPATGTGSNAKPVRGGSAAAKPAAASGQAVAATANSGAAPNAPVGGGTANKARPPSSTGPAKTGSAQRKPPTDRPVSAIAAAQKGVHKGDQPKPLTSNAETAGKKAIESAAKSTASPAAIKPNVPPAAPRDRPLTASHAGAKGSAKKKEETPVAVSDPEATLVAVCLPTSTTLEQVKQLFEKAWALASARQVLPKGPKDPLGIQVHVTFSKATDGVFLGKYLF